MTGCALSDSLLTGWVRAANRTLDPTRCMHTYWLSLNSAAAERRMRAFRDVEETRLFVLVQKIRPVGICGAELTANLNISCRHELCLNWIMYAI